MLNNVLAIIAVILPVMIKFIPALKPIEEKIKARLERNSDNVERFKKTRDTTGLGNFPDKD